MVEIIETAGFLSSHFVCGGMTALIAGE